MPTDPNRVHIMALRQHPSFTSMCWIPYYWVHSSNADVFLVVVRLWLNYAKVYWQIVHRRTCNRHHITISKTFLFVTSFKRQNLWLKNSQLVFAARQHIGLDCYAERCSYDRFGLSDRLCLSVSRWHHAKTTPATIMRSSLEDSPIALVSP